MTTQSEPRFRRFLALGDSFTEGVGDVDPNRPNGVRGWADRVAEVLASRDPGFDYANLAIRGRKLDAIVAEQIDPALQLSPDLITIYAGANDILRPRVDVDALLTRYAQAVARLSQSGARVAVFTAHDTGPSRVWATLRGRFETYSDGVRELARTYDCTLVDYWRLRPVQDRRHWGGDRIHMNSSGHQLVAIAVLEALGVPHSLAPLPLSAPPSGGAIQRAGAQARWIGEHAIPWVRRRLTGRSSGDDLDPRFATPVHSPAVATPAIG